MPGREGASPSGSSRLVLVMGFLQISDACSTTGSTPFSLPSRPALPPSAQPSHKTRAEAILGGGVSGAEDADTNPYTADIKPNKGKIPVDGPTGAEKPRGGKRDNRPHHFTPSHAFFGISAGNPSRDTTVILRPCPQTLGLGERRVTFEHVIWCAPCVPWTCREPTGFQPVACTRFSRIENRS